MLPLKWKIFRVVTYLHMTCTAVLAAAAILSILELGLNFYSWESLIALIVILIIPLVLLANSSINILLLERYYPDRLPGKALGRFSNTLFFASIVVVLFLVVGMVMFLYEMLAAKDMRRESGFLMLYIATICVIGLTGCYILWAQVSLRKALRRNHHSTINNFLASDEL